MKLHPILVRCSFSLHDSQEGNGQSTPAAVSKTYRFLPSPAELNAKDCAWAGSQRAKWHEVVMSLLGMALQVSTHWLGGEGRKG